MPYLQFREQRVTLTSADQAIGAFDGAAIRIPGDDPAARAIVRLGADGTGIIARGSPTALVSVNGVQLGAEPSPLLHGDKVEIGGQQLHYGDDAKGGSTQFISAAALAEQVRAAGSAPKKPTSATGGRLVSLVDGREYAISEAGVTFGREIGNDIVVASGEVSRRHAQIAPGEGGYILTDLSTNGVLINGSRVAQTQVLGRGDVIRLGGEEFRFYADKVKEPAASATPPAAPEVPATPAPAAAPPPPEPAFVVEQTAPPAVIHGTAERVAASPAGPDDSTIRPGAKPPVSEEATRPSVARTPIASLEIINEGPMKGKRFEIYTPLTNIGRGAHNDIAIANESVSDSHAKILRKDGHWYVVDQGSTNGTYLSGRRVQGEQQLVGAPDVRFGDIKVTFRPAAGHQDAGGSTRAVAAVHVDAARRMSTHQQQGPTAPAAANPVPTAAPKLEKPFVNPEVQVPEKKKGCAAVIAFVIALGAAGAGMLVVILSIGS
ncbi:MAG: FHA domain-containing protein [Gemmatimonadota bacterium]|nr:FHA domain-containing protein [Gemmatimonadota bacterium]